MKKIIALIGICSLCVYVLTGCQDQSMSIIESNETSETDVVSGVYDAPMIAFPNVEGELLELGEGDYKVTVVKKVVDGEAYYILGGDMLLDEEQVEFLRNRGSDRSAGKATDISDVQPGLDPDYATFLTDLNKLWPNNTIYYSFHSNLTSSERNVINQALNHWRSNTNLTFTERTNQSKYIQFVPRSPGSGCSAPLGMPNSKGEINLARIDSEGRTCFTQGVISHEIGHAVGLFHEHQRSDRNNYVTIHTQNINLSSSGRTVNFGIYGGRSLSEGFEIRPLDFNSIMIYPSCAFSINQPCNSSNATITRKDGSIYAIFSNTSLSFGDREGVKYLYYPGVYVKLEKVWNQSESFDERENSPNGIGNYLDVFDVTVHFYSNSNFTTPKTLDYPIRFNYRYNCTSFNEGCAHPSGTQTLLIPSGVTSYFVGKDTYRGYDIQYTPQWYARSTIVSRDGIGYN